MTTASISSSANIDRVHQIYLLPPNRPNRSRIALGSFRVSSYRPDNGLANMVAQCFYYPVSSLLGTSQMQKFQTPTNLKSQIISMQDTRSLYFDPRTGLSAMSRLLLSEQEQLFAEVVSRSKLTGCL